MIDCHALLAGDKNEADAQLHDKDFQLTQDGRFQIFFLINTFQAEKTEEIRITKHEIKAHLIHLPQRSKPKFHQLIRLSRKGGSFMQHGSDLLPQGTDTPAFNPTHLGVEIALERFIENQ